MRIDTPTAAVSHGRLAGAARVPRFALFCLLGALLLCVPAQAAVDGHVINQTTGKPQPGSLVTLYRVGEGGMQPVKAVPTDASGSFHFDETVQGPHLLQAIYGGVVYNQMLTPDSPTDSLKVAVYESDANPGEARVTQHMVLVEPGAGVYHVSESVIFQNEGTRTFNNSSDGTLRLYLPSGLQGNPQLEVTAPQGMAVVRPIQKTSDPNVYMVDFPVKPGETRFDVTYVAAVPESGRFQGKALHGGAAMRLVTPSGVSLTGDMITLVGEEPTTRASVYEVAGSDFDVTVEGSGQLSRAVAEEPPQSAGLQRVEARVYERLHLILGLTLLMLLAAFLFLYRRGEPK